MHRCEPSWLNLPIGVPTLRALLITIGALAGMALGVSAETDAAVSIPDRRMRSEASVGDTAVLLDIVTLPMTATLWKLGSVPSVGSALNARVLSPTSLLLVPNAHNAELHGYSPYAVVKERDLNPTLTFVQGAQNNHPVLALSIPRRPLSAAPSDSLWASITYRLDPVGIDLTPSKFIELWVNDFRDESRIRGPGARLHIDLGAVSEDQMRSPDQPPNQRLDTEEQGSPDHVLTPAEDTGVDEAGNATNDALSAPLDLSTANEQDRAGDDYAGPSDQYREIDPRRWARTNGTEGNRSVLPYPDTEDLNLNGLLDTNEDYYEYTIDLSATSTRYLATDVYSEFAGMVAPDNGWRRYRIPIDDAERLEFGAPGLATVRHVRVWVDGLVSPDPPEDALPKRPLLMLGGVLIAGEFHGAYFVDNAPPVVMRSPWPNPARESVSIELAVGRPQPIDLTLYDLGGRRVRRLSQGTLEIGRHGFTWDGRDAAGARVSPGLYLVEARGPGLALFAKVLLLE